MGDFDESYLMRIGYIDTTSLISGRNHLGVGVETGPFDGKALATHNVDGNEIICRYCC